MPVKASSEATDRSTPPVSSTNVSPTERIPTIATWRRTLKMLSGVRKPGAVRAKAMQITRKATSVPCCRQTCRARWSSSWPSVAARALSAGVTFALPATVVAPVGARGADQAPLRRARHHLLLVGLRPRQVAGNAPLAHDQDPVAHAQHFWQLGGD